MIVHVLTLHGAVVELDERIHPFLTEQPRLFDGCEEPFLLPTTAFPKVAHVDEKFPLRTVAQQLTLPLPLALFGDQFQVYLASTHLEYNKKKRRAGEKGKGVVVIVLIVFAYNDVMMNGWAITVCCSRRARCSPERS